jgi:hypothetical protein
MLVDDYILNASTEMAKNFRERHILFPVGKDHLDILPILQNNWKEKNINTILFKESVVIDKKTYNIFKLTW